MFQDSRTSVEREEDKVSKYAQILAPSRYLAAIKRKVTINGFLVALRGWFVYFWTDDRQFQTYPQSRTLRVCRCLVSGSLSPTHLPVPITRSSSHANMSDIAYTQRDW